MLAWLSVSPDKESELTNAEMYGGNLPELPFEIGHLPVMFLEVGAGEHGDEGLKRLTFREIQSWSSMTGTELTRMEVIALREMSSAYVSIANQKDPDCPIQSDEVMSNKNTANAASWAAYGKKSE